MNSIRQLIRQPLKTLSGILLVGLAVAVLCVSFSQTLAAEDTVAKLKESFITVALPASTEQEAMDWIDTIISDSGIVEKEQLHGLASAYIPSLKQDNETVHLAQTLQRSTNHDFVPQYPVYARAMLEITVTEILENTGEGETHYVILPDTSGPTTETVVPENSYCTVKGVIDRVIGLEEGYHDPTGYNVTIYIRQEIPNLTEGQRCLVYSDYYRDMDWELRSSYMNDGDIFFWEEGVEVPYWHMDTLRPTTVLDSEAYQAARREAGEHWHTVNQEDFKYDSYFVRLGDLYINLYRYHLEMFRTISLIVEDTGSAAPGIIPLEGSAESFLDSAEGAVWHQALDDIEINAHNFPVIAVEDLGSYGDFACGRVEVTVGREFTPEEIATGAKVCILSKSLAEANGFAVGDQISAQFINFDTNDPDQYTVRKGEGIVNPTAHGYDSAEMTLTDAEVFTIVGLYDQDSPWDNVDYNYYSFTPNTVFIPVSAVSSSVEYSDCGMFRTLILDGDRLMELQYLAVQEGMEGVLYFYDNGYTDLAASLAGYRDAANQILPLGVLVYCVLMVLYLLLFPGRQQRELTMMDSMGAPMWPRVWHILLSTVGVLIPGSVLGAALGIGSWQYVSIALAKYMDVGVEIILDVHQLWVVSALQAAAVALAAAVLGFVLANHTNYMKRK